MKNELKENKYIILILGVLVIALILTPVLYKNLNSNKDTIKQTNENTNLGNIKNNESSNNKDTPLDNNQDNSDRNIVDNKNHLEIDSSTPNTTNNGSNNSNNNNININNTGDDYNNTKINNDQPTSTETDVITYFEETDKLIATYSKQPMTDNIKTKLKNSFTTIVDFLFYDKPIKGHTFKELTLSAKLKVCKIALSIDNKIDSYFPNYKDTIKNGFTSLKAKTVSLYLTLTSKACEVVGSTVCNQARSDFKNMKEILSIDWDFIKEFAGNSKEAISEWYQSLK